MGENGWTCLVVGGADLLFEILLGASCEGGEGTAGCKSVVGLRSCLGGSGRYDMFLPKAEILSMVKGSRALGGLWGEAMESVDPIDDVWVEVEVAGIGSRKGAWCRLRYQRTKSGLAVD